MHMSLYPVLGLLLFEGFGISETQTRPSEVQ